MEPAARSESLIEMQSGGGEGGFCDVFPFKTRGEREDRGVAYFDGDEDKGPGRALGVAYQVRAFSVNVPAETFQLLIGFHFRYTIPDEDFEAYKAAKAKRLLTFEELNQMQVKVKPPVFELNNATTEREVAWSAFRIADVNYCKNPRDQSWSWYVTFFCHLETTCSEEFELQRFPFSRQPFQLNLQIRKPTFVFHFVPFNDPDFQPLFEMKLTDGAKVVKEIPPRPNGYKASLEPNTLIVENHHVAIRPMSSLTPSPSGATYAVCLITIQGKQKAGFFLWNTVPILFSLPVFSALAVVVDIPEVADRAATVFALLLTMATYKVSILSWMPQKSYLTLLDVYILGGFGCILLIGFVVGVCSTLVKFGYADNDEEFMKQVQSVERTIVVAITGFWVLFHMFCGIAWPRFYPDWGAVMRYENEKLEVKKEPVLSLPPRGQLPSPPASVDEANLARLGVR